MRNIKKFLSCFAFKKGSDPIITLCVLVLAILGALMTTSTSVGVEMNMMSLVFYFIKQMGFVIVGILTMNFVSNVFSFRFVDKHIFAITLVMMMLLLIPLVFSAENGAKAWIRLPGGMSVQPSEFFKIFLITLIGVCVERTKSSKTSFWRAFRPIWIFLGAGTGIIAILQHDLGTTIIILTIAIILLVIPYHRSFTKTQFLIIKICSVGLLFLVFFLTNPGLELITNLLGGKQGSYKVQRFMSALNPFLDDKGSGLQLIYGMQAMANGGVFGVGFGNSTIKFLIPEGRTDYILAIFIEELGLIGFLLITCLFILIISRLIYYALHSKSESFKVILLGVALYFTLHYILNVGGVSGLIPLTGIPLLMVSAGGTSLVAVFLGIGICQGLISIIKRDMLGVKK